MSNAMEVRRALAEVAFDGVDITASIQPYLLSLTYTDSEEGEADDLQIKLQDRDGLWQQQWLGQMIHAAASTEASASPTPAPVDESRSFYRTTAKIGLNVRSGPGITYSRYGTLVYGTELSVRGMQNNWAEIDYHGKTAYVSADYLERIEGAAVEPSAVSAATGFKIQAVIAATNWNGDGGDLLLDCGQFELDSVDCSGPPSTVQIKATALPYSAQIRQTKKSKAWEAYCLSGIAKEIAAKSGMACMFLAGSDPSYRRVEQYQTSDIQFLSRLCQEAGLSLKATNNILVLFDQAEYEAKSPVLTIARGDGSYTKWNLKTSEADVHYASCRVRWTTSRGTLIEGVARVEDYDIDDDCNQQLEIRARVDSVSEAQALAAKQLRLHNKYAKTASFTLPGNPLICSGSTVELTGWGAWDGSYIVSRAKHSLSNSYTTQIELRKSLEGY